MIKMLDWIPESLPPSGGLSAEGFTKLLGRPSLDPLTVLVRETAQNSWDARDDSGRPVIFHLEMKHLEARYLDVLKTEVFPGAKLVAGVPLAATLDDQDLYGLVISDRNTKGLGGPLRADVIDPSGTYDWVNFVLNVGKANAGVHKGGTYGFGKTISYVASQANTIVIYSRTSFNGSPVTRLIASAIGSKFDDGESNFTGRHWWGRDIDGIPMPLENHEADELARRIGLPGFEPDEFGTSILILSPDLGSRTLDQALTFIADTILWHLWPKMLHREGCLPMEFKLSHNGMPLKIPNVIETPPLHKYAEAFLALEGYQDAPLGYQENAITRHANGKKNLLGRLATVPFVKVPYTINDDGHDPENEDSPPPASPVGLSSSHHVALMRTPELIVHYLPGPPAPDSAIEWAGVFRAEDEFDNVFADSEPPTHDSWSPEYLVEKEQKLTVRKCIRDIGTISEKRWGTPNTPPPNSTTSTSHLADILSHLVSGIAASGKGKGEFGGNSSKASPAATKLNVEWIDVVDHPEGVYSSACFSATVPASVRECDLKVAIGVALDGSGRDLTLDPSLGLRSCTVNGESHDVTGVDCSIRLLGGARYEAVFEATSNGRFSVLWEATVKSRAGMAE